MWNIRSNRQTRLVQQLWMHRVSNLKAINLYADMLRGLQNLNSFVWILWMDVETLILFEPFVGFVGSDCAIVFQRAGLKEGNCGWRCSIIDN